MSRKYKIYDQDRMYFVTYAVVGWIDVFTRAVYRNILLDSLRYCCEHKGLEIYAWCIMTNHVHLIIGTYGNNMEDILRDHKSHTAKTIVNAIAANAEESRREWMLSSFKAAGIANSKSINYQFWQQHNRPIELYSKPVITQKLNYIHNNPVEAGFVSQAEDWLYSSARDYAGGTGILDCMIPIDIGIYG
jgi:putative transposase